MRLAAAVAVVALCGVSSAQSWLANGGFDANTDGWAESFGNGSSFGYHNGTEGYTSPGAAAVVVGIEGDSIAFSQCIDMTPQAVDLVFYSKVLQSGGGQNIGTGSVSFFSTSGCANTYIENRPIARVESLAGGWKRQTLLGVAAPAATRSAMVFVSNRVSSDAGDTSATVVFDDIAFGPAGSFYTPPASSNLLANPDFEFSREQWSLVAPGNASSYTSWSHADGYGGIGGSLTLVANGAGDQTGVAQCVNIAAQAVDLQLYSRLNYTGGGPNTGTASVSSFSAPDCAGGYIENRSAPLVSTDAAGWRRFLLRGYTLPATTHSARVSFTVALQGPDDTSVSMAADHFGFGPANTFVDGLFANGFE